MLIFITIMTTPFSYLYVMMKVLLADVFMKRIYPHLLQVRIVSPIQFSNSHIENNFKRSLLLNFKDRNDSLNSSVYSYETNDEVNSSLNR
jgi:hypothetical protein